MHKPPQKIKIGRDKPLKTHLDETKDEHNGHGYADWSAEIARHIETDGKIVKARLARYMNVKRTETVENWLAVDPRLQG